MIVGKGNSLQKWQFLVYMLDFWSVVLGFQKMVVPAPQDLTKEHCFRNRPRISSENKKP